MKLKDFVAETLKEIIDGVVEAQDYYQEQGGNVIGNVEYRGSGSSGEQWSTETGQPVQMIEFDVAVTTTEGTEKSGGVGVFVGSVGLGTKGKIDEKSTASSRIKFSVPIFLPSNHQKKETKGMSWG